MPKQKLIVLVPSNAVELDSIRVLNFVHEGRAHKIFIDKESALSYIVERTRVFSDAVFEYGFGMNNWFVFGRAK